MQIVIHDNTACIALSPFAMVSSYCGSSNGFSVSIAVAFLSHCGISGSDIKFSCCKKCSLGSSAFPGGEKKIIESFAT